MTPYKYFLGALRPLWISWQRAQLSKHGYVVNHVGRRLYVSSSDPRALRLGRNRGETSPVLVRLWKALLSEMTPVIVIDIGANYGEVALAADYGECSEVHLFEVNPAISQYLRKSVNASGLSKQVTIHEVAASDVDGTAELAVFEDSSGLSTLEVAPGGERRPVTTRRIDSILQPPSKGSVVFKIDVEGHELSVLRGMRDLLNGREYAGIVELWPGEERVERILSEHTVSLVHKDTLQRRPVQAHVLAEHLVRPGSEFLRDVLITPRK